MRRLPCGRREARKRAGFDCRLSLPDGEVLDARVEDVSAVGVRLSGCRPLAEGMRVGLCVTIAETAAPLWLRAEIMRADADEMGLELLAVTPELARELRQRLAPLPVAGGAAARFAFADGSP